MKKILAFLLAALSCTMAMAVNEDLPSSTLLLELPKGAKVLAKRDIHVTAPTNVANMYQAHLSGNSVFNSYAGQFTVAKGEALRLKAVDRAFGGLRFDMADQHDVYFLPPEASDARTVGDFNRIFSDSLMLVWDDPEADPFPGVSDDVKQDLLMTRILAAIKANKYQDTLPDFARLEKLSVKQPESFYYYYIVALDKSNRGTAAKSRGTEFLKTYGKKSKYYNEVLGIVAK